MPKREAHQTVARTMRIQQGKGWRFQVEIPSLHVRVEAGPDQGLQGTFSLPRIRIGCGEDNDLVLTDPTVSRRHAELRSQEGQVLLVDLDSTNGSFVGAARVQEAALGPGGEFRLGDSTLRVEPTVQRRASLVGSQATLGGLVGRSEPMRELYALLKAIAPTQATVLIQGETGTGKELVARTIHELSGQPGPLVTFDCGAADPATIRSDLFGHRKGAFTGATGDRKGVFREAARGTVFLDEVGELPLEIQPRLLRALEAREVTPMGADRAVPVQVRVLSATHRDLAAMVEAGEFRADLFHRLAVMRVDTPPLRARTDDIAALAEHLLEQVAPGARLGPEALPVLEGHGWPGNVRELRNVLEQAAALAAGQPIGPPHLRLQAAPAPPPATPSPPAPSPGPTPGEARSLKDLEREQIVQALERNRWNQSAAARELGISRSTLKRRLKEFGLRGSRR